MTLINELLHAYLRGTKYINTKHSPFLMPLTKQDVTYYICIRTNQANNVSSDLMPASRSPCLIILQAADPD